MTDSPLPKQARELHHRYRVAVRLVEKTLRETRPLVAERGPRFNQDDLLWRLEDATKRVERLGFSMSGVLAGLDPFGVHGGIHMVHQSQDADKQAALIEEDRRVLGSFIAHAQAGDEYPGVSIQKIPRNDAE